MWLYSWIHAETLARARALVANCSTERSSNSRVECQDSMTAVAGADPGLPIDWQTESRWQAARKAPAVYSLPRSVLNRIRFNSDYAEDGVKPRNYGLAWSAVAC